MTSTATIARYIVPSTATGKATRRSNALRSDVFTAAELAEAFGVGTVREVWEFSGHTHDGVALYCRTRFVGQEDGALAGYDATGRLLIVHPAERQIRIVTQ
jgi:hypothetical protein